MRLSGDAAETAFAAPIDSAQANTAGPPAWGAARVRETFGGDPVERRRGRRLRARYATLVRKKDVAITPQYKFRIMTARKTITSYYRQTNCCVGSPQRVFRVLRAGNMSVSCNM